MDKKHEQSTLGNRRGFLAGSAATGVAGVAAVSLLSKAAPEPTAPTAPAATDDSSKGYQVSEHVKRYYRSTTV
jgi:nitrous oxide reductase